MSWYKDGSVNIVQGSNTVIGVGTKWTNPLIGVCAGQMLILKTANTIEIYEIASVQSDTQLTLANQYSGTTQTGVSYEIPTAPKISIEALALRISEMLNYYQQQMNGWQSILTGTSDITLTAPDGRVVTIKSQTALTEAINNTIKSQNELTKTVNDAINSQNELIETAKNTIKKSGEENQSIDGSLDVKKLTENGVRVYSPDNKPSADDIGALAATKTVVNNVPTYKVGTQVSFDLKPKIAGIEPVYIVESYRNGDNWYNVYSNGFIEQSGTFKVSTPTENTVYETAINLLKPMKTQNYGVTVDKVSSAAPWAQTEYSYAELYTNSFYLSSYSSVAGETWIRWTVRGY